MEQVFPPLLPPYLLELIHCRSSNYGQNEMYPKVVHTNKDELDLASIYLLTVQLRTNNHHIHVDKFIQLSVAIVQLR